jgi:50S ribosomal protein L16 3-hydroxylase
MRRHWQREPLLARAALPELAPLTRARLFALAAHDDVESRLVECDARGRFTLTHGPFRRSALPPLGRRGWTLLVQGVDLHADDAHALLGSFRFLPAARIDDLMISWASDGGGVGPHVDSYDVFLLQARGRRRWRISSQRNLALDERAPLKILRRFVPSAEYVLEPGDLLYLPPRWAHEGVAVGGDCMTYSIGMRAPQRGSLAAEIVQRLAETHEDATLYRDPGQSATARPAAIPAPLAAFAADAVRRLVARRAPLARALGEVLSEPKAHVWFAKSAAAWRPGAVTLDRRTRMLYDARRVFINGESVAARGRDAALLHRLADERSLDARAVRGASRAALALLAEWLRAGWLHAASHPPRAGATR